MTIERVRDRVRGLARLPATRLRPAGRNFRTHDSKQRGILRGVLAEIGFAGALLAWVPDDAARAALRATPENGFDAWLASYDGVLELIDGHMRADELKGHDVPVLVTDLSEHEAAKALATFDAVSDLAGRDAALLAELLAEVGTAREPGTEELLDMLRGDDIGATGATNEQLEATPAVDEVEPRTKVGDLWVLGRHRLLCGDSTRVEDVARVMSGALASLLWTDPPYNVAVVGGRRDDDEAARIARGNKTIANDAMSDEGFRAFLRSAFASCDAAMVDGAAFYIAHADSEGYNFRGAVRDIGWKTVQCLVWVKAAFVLSRQDYHWRHEPILYGWKLGAAHHAVEDRTQDTVWEFPRGVADKTHPTMKPVELVARAVRNSTDRGAIVLDAFGGSGTTLVACEAHDRSARLVELDPRYCDVIVARWEKLTGQAAHREDA